MNFRLPLLLCALLCLLIPADLFALEARGRVLRVEDGDSLFVQTLGKVRLLGIDAPEWKDGPRDDYYLKQGISQAQLRVVAKQARSYLAGLVMDQEILLKTEETRRDSYGRLLAYAYLKDGRLVNRMLIEKGLASTFRRYAFSLKKEFLKAEDRARKKGLGLWSTPKKRNR